MKTPTRITATEATKISMLIQPGICTAQIFQRKSSLLPPWTPAQSHAGVSNLQQRPGQTSVHSVLTRYQQRTQQTDNIYAMVMLLEHHHEQGPILLRSLIMAAVCCAGCFAGVSLTSL